MADASQPWEYAGRYYLISVFRDDEQGGAGWELEDAGPAPSLGIVLEAYRADGGEFTFTAYTDHSLPFDLVHRFVTEAAQAIPPEHRHCP